MLPLALDLIQDVRSVNLKGYTLLNSKYFIFHHNVRKVNCVHVTKWSTMWLATAALCQITLYCSKSCDIFCFFARWPWIFLACWQQRSRMVVLNVAANMYNVSRWPKTGIKHTQPLFSTCQHTRTNHCPNGANMHEVLLYFPPWSSMSRILDLWLHSSV